MGTIKNGYKWLGAKIGGNSVNGIAKGGNIIYKKIDPTLILDCDFNNNFTNKVPDGVKLIAGNVNGLPSFVSDGSGGYALDFGGTKSIKTAVNLPINTSDKISIKFDIKTSATAGQVVMEISTNYGLNNSFGIFLNDTLANRIEIADHNSGYNVGNSAVNINDGSYHPIKIVIDRSLGTAQNKIYVDGVLSYVQNTSLTADNNGNFGSFTLFIGQRNGSSVGFVGQMKNLKIWNRIITQSEIDNL